MLEIQNSRGDTLDCPRAQQEPHLGRDRDQRRSGANPNAPMTKVRPAPKMSAKRPAGTTASAIAIENPVIAHWTDPRLLEKWS